MHSEPRDAGFAEGNPLLSPITTQKADGTTLAVSFSCGLGMHERLRRFSKEPSLRLDRSFFLNDAMMWGGTTDLVKLNIWIESDIGDNRASFCIDMIVHCTIFRRNAVERSGETCNNKTRPRSLVPTLQSPRHQELPQTVKG